MVDKNGVSIGKNKGEPAGNKKKNGKRHSNKSEFKFIV